MTYKQFVDTLGKISLTQHNIHTSGYGDLYKDLNANPSVKYGVFYVTPNQSYRNGDFDYFNINAFVIDRLVDMDGTNTLQVQSIAKETLDNIFKIFCEQYDAEIEGNVYFQMFTQRFADLTAGCYFVITLAVPVDSICIND